MITDLFSHKIHSSGLDWPDKLIELAAIFSEFDGHVFDREQFANRLQDISPRVSYLAADASSKPATAAGRLDVSKFRDEISAYPAYLGLYYLEKSDEGWIVRVSQTAKKFLLCEEPDVASFLRIQLPLFQYPNAMGAAYQSNTNKLRIQSNARDRTLDFIDKKIHLAPVRLVAIALNADAQLRGIKLQDASISFDEIFGLANSPIVNCCAMPSIVNVIEVLTKIRNGTVIPPENYESRFHILTHLEIFTIKSGAISLRNAVNSFDAIQIETQLNTISNINNQFNGFDNCKNAVELENVIASADWGKYFDGVKLLPSNIIDILSKDLALHSSSKITQTRSRRSPSVLTTATELYDFRERTDTPLKQKPFNRNREIADPEITHIKMQRRNLAHKELIDKMDKLLRDIGARPQENDHIDLYAKIPNDGSFIFEMKSGGESLLDQIRKGLSQLYEYRYRYREVIQDDHISLCLVLPESPSSIPWVTNYLCEDRDIHLCWFSEDGNLKFPINCADKLSIFCVNRV